MSWEAVNNLLLVILLPLAVVGAIARIFVGVRRESRRCKAIEDVASRLGFKYSRRHDEPRMWANFKITPRGDSKQFRNWIEGRSQRFDVAIFEFICSDSDGGSIHSVIWFECEEMQLPLFDVSLNWIASNKVTKSFNFSTGELDTIKTIARSAKWTIEGLGKDLIAYQPSTRLNPDGVPKFLEDGLQIATAIFKPQFEKDSVPPRT